MRLWIDILGCLLFLLPICVILVYFTWPWFTESWRINETSSNAGGLIRWPVKLLLPVGFALMALQGVSELVKRKIESGVVKPNEGMRILNQYTRVFDENTYLDIKVLKRD